MSHRQVLSEIRKLTNNFISYLPSELLEELLLFLDTSPYLIASTLFFSLILNRKTNQLYFFSNSESRGSSTFILMDTLINNPIIFVTANEYHAILLDCDNKAYGISDILSDSTSFGLEDTVSTVTPRLIQPLSQEQIRFATCGYNYTIFLNTKGEAFSCGSDSQGELGPGADRGFNNIGKIPNLQDYKIVSAAAGSYHTLFLTDSGKVLACGDRENYIISIVPEPQFYPELLYFPEKIIDISCQKYRSLFLTKNKMLIAINGRRSTELTNIRKMKSNRNLTLFITEEGQLLQNFPLSASNNEKRWFLNQLVDDKRIFKDFTFTEDHIFLVDRNDKLIYCGENTLKIQDLVDQTFNDV